jgi:hypothetical protein
MHSLVDIAGFHGGEYEDNILHPDNGDSTHL